MDDITLKKLQSAELDILKDIDSFCKKYSINYSLYGGTLIGAVRHQGFIPWDDDIDIVMTRSEYTEFCNTWAADPLEGYYLENFETDDYTQNTHSKIRKNGTMLLSDIEDENIGHHGIWIDIFVMDKISYGPAGTEILKKGKKMILLAKANGYFPGENWKLKIARALLRIVYPSSYRKRKLHEIANLLRANDTMTKTDYYRCDMCMLSYLNVRFPGETGKEYTTLPFEGKNYQVFSNYNEVLEVMYGDYMKMPPEEERVCKHRPKKIIYGEMPV